MFKHLDDITCSSKSLKNFIILNRFCRRALTISPFCNSTYAIYHPAEQIPTPVPLKTDLQFSVKWRCCTWFSLWQTNGDYKAHQMLLQTGKPSEPPESPSPRDYSLPKLIKPLSKRLRHHEWNQEEALYRALCLSRFRETLIKILLLLCAD